MSDAILLFAHGSRDPEWPQPFRRLKETLHSRLPGHRLELAFLESMRPTFDEAADDIAASGKGVVTVVPLFLAQGGHLREDIPNLISAARRRHPELEFRLLPPLGDAPDVLNAIAAWIAQSQTSP
jgi:sirohydrochlorin cobaltochelatase